VHGGQYRPPPLSTPGRCGQAAPVEWAPSSVGIKLNQRVSLRRCAVTISFAGDSRPPLEFHLCGRLGCRGGSLALVPVRLCRTHFQALNERKPMQQQHMPTFWPSIVVFTCVAIVAFGALALIGWIALALLGYCGCTALSSFPFYPATRRANSKRSRSAETGCPPPPRSLRLSRRSHSAALPPTTTPHFPLPHESPNRDAQSRSARHHHPDFCYYALLRRLGYG
jgi:hypothetical protein